MKKIASSITRPLIVAKEVTKAILLFPEELKEHVDKLGLRLKEKNYGGAGYHLGFLMKLVFLRRNLYVKPNETTAEKVGEFFLGFVMAVL